LIVGCQVHKTQQCEGRAQLHPLGISQYRLSRAVGVPPRRINEIVQLAAHRDELDKIGRLVA